MEGKSCVMTLLWHSTIYSVGYSEPIYSSISMHRVVDAEFASNFDTDYYHTGTLTFVNKKSIIWYSNRQNTFNTYTQCIALVQWSWLMHYNSSFDSLAWQLVILSMSSLTPRLWQLSVEVETEFKRQPFIQRRSCTRDNQHGNWFLTDILTKLMPQAKVDALRYDVLYSCQWRQLWFIDVIKLVASWAQEKWWE